MSDDLGWDSDGIRNKIEAFGKMQGLIGSIYENLGNRPPLHVGDVIPGDDLTESAESVFGPKGKQTEQIRQYGVPLAKTVGANGEKLGLTDAINDNTEDGNTETGGSWSTGGRHG